MISLELAYILQAAGLDWQPKLHDFFTLPDTELADSLFVVSDMMIDVQQLFGGQVITFNGAVEWSLDFVTIADALWLPTEEQLREALQELLLAEEQPAVELICSLAGYLCRIRYQGTWRIFEDISASDAYARAIAYLLTLKSGLAPGKNGPQA